MRTSSVERRTIVDKAHKSLSISRQCELLDIHRSGYYYKPCIESQLNLHLMELIDKQYMDKPFMGVPSMTQWLRQDIGIMVNKKRVERLYKLMNLQAIVPGPHTSKPNRFHKIYPYLLRNLKITHPNQVWELDITFVPIKKGYLYLIAFIDLYSRYVVHWSLSNTMTAEWCKESLKEAIEMHGAPEIINTDQGSQFTSEVFTSYVLDKEKHDIKLSMDGKGRATDNIFIERLWRSVKYENIYLNCYEDGIELYKGLKHYFTFYNQERRHSSINYQHPQTLYLAAA
jgi:putative transposase